MCVSAPLNEALDPQDCVNVRCRRGLGFSHHTLVAEHCLKVPRSSRAVAHRAPSVQQKQMFALQKMIRKHGRAARAPEATQVPFGGQGQSKQEMWGVQRALQGPLSKPSLTFIFTLVTHPWEGQQEQEDNYLHASTASVTAFCSV